MSLMREVVALVSNIELGGIGIQARGLAEKLHSQGMVTELLLLNDKHFDEPLLSWYRSALPTRLIDERILRSTGPRTLWKLYRFFRGRPEAILHFHSFSQEFINWQAIVAGRLAGKLIAITLHHTVHWNRTDRLGLLAQRIAWQAAHLLIVTTEASREFVCEKLPPTKVEVVPCGIAIPTPSLTRAQSREQFGLSSDDFVVASAGRISSHKGFFELVEAVAQLSPSFPQLKLVIAGDGKDFESLSKVAEGKPFVKLTGRVENLSDVLVAADVFAMPSSEEGFGLVYGEAALLGIPSIGGRLPQVAEVIRDGETGWLVRPRDVAELVSLLHTLIPNPELVRTAGMRAEEYCRRFEMSAVAEQLGRLFERRFGPLVCRYD